MIWAIRRVLDDFKARRLRKKISPQRRKLMIEYAKAEKAHRHRKPIRKRLSDTLHDEMKLEQNR